MQRSVRDTTLAKTPPQQVPSVPHRSVRHFKRTLIAAALFVTALAAYVVSRFIPSLPNPVHEFFLAFTAAMAVHLLDRLWLFRDTQESLNDLKGEIVERGAAETKALVAALDKGTKEALEGILGSIQNSINSLAAMAESGILRLFRGRGEASVEMLQDINRATTHSIRLMGISLNDFILRKDPSLGKAWHSIQEHIKTAQREPLAARQLEIKVLLIDPQCLGAQLRSKGEERTGPYQAGRLKDDVDAAIDLLLALQNSCNQQGTTFECRLYRLPPILFLCHLDSVCYVQPYHFWSSRMDNKSLPMLKFQDQPADSDQHSIYSELKQHFEWIWEEASVDLESYKNGLARGVDRGIAQAGLVNVYTDTAEALRRMEYLLTEVGSTEKAAGDVRKVSIQGISLHSFFNPNSPQLYKAIHELIKRDEVYLDLLFLDPDCEQAKFRAYREYSFLHPDCQREQYLQAGSAIHQSTTLHRDTADAIAELEAMIRDIASDKPPKWRPKVKAGLYDSAPYCFLLRVADTVLVEQYHYGKLPDSGNVGRLTLGKEFPLMEYYQAPRSVFPTIPKTPFALLENHFEFALRQASSLPIQEWADSASRLAPQNRTA
jgi:hypothetical protein